MRTSRLWGWTEAIVIILTLLVLGYPTAFYTTHGIDSTGWPDVELLKLDHQNLYWIDPSNWWAHVRSGDVLFAISTYVKMYWGEIDSLPDGGKGWLIGMGLASLPWLMLLLRAEVKEPKRDTSNIYGGARWANIAERAILSKGIEIGRDPDTDKPIRVLIESNLVSIAPPRSGKTTGLVLPNLVFSDRKAYSGPVVVIDPKGDAYRAAKDRREALGYTVRCFDPLRLVNQNTDRWEPMMRYDADDVISLQAIAANLPQQAEHTSDGGQFYEQLMINHVAAAFAAAIRENRANAVYAAELARSPLKLRQALSGRSDALSVSVMTVLDGEDDRVRNNVLNTVSKAFSWSIDPKVQASLSNPTFNIGDLTDGKTDLFVILPTDKRRETLAPLIRWLFAEIFNAVRQQRAKKRLLVIIDEAFSLGNFSALAQAVGELPGYGVSFWTIWQSWYQIVTTYGSSGAPIFLQTAEVTTLSNLDATIPDETERWSKALGKFTHIEETETFDKTTGRLTLNRRSVGVDLVPPSALPELTRERLIAFLNTKRATSHPLKLVKNFAPGDPRFKDLIVPIEPVGPTEAE